MIPHFDRVCTRWLIVLLPVVVLSVSTLQAAKATSPASGVKQPVREWFVLGPVASPIPAFSGGGETKFGSSDLLEYEHTVIRDLDPTRGGLVGGSGQLGRAAWTAIGADTGGVVLPIPQLPSIAYLAAYVEVPRWTKVDIEARSRQSFEIFVDGLSVVKQKGPQKKDDKTPASTGTAKLVRGKHLLVVKTVNVPGDTLGEWRTDVRMGPGPGFHSTPVLSLDPARGVTISDILDPPTVSEVQLSPDGKYAAVSISERRPPEGKRNGWIEVMEFKTARLVTTLRDMPDASDWEWAPTGRRISYVVTKDEAGTLHMLDIDTGESTTILRDVKNLSGYTWGPDGSFVVYSVREEPPKDDTGVTRLRGLYDRRAGERNKTHLYVSTVPGGMTRRLTAGEYSAFMYDVHPDGKSVLVGRTYEDLSVRPYSTTELVRVKLDDQTSEVLWKGHWLGNARWSPGGKKILITAGPSAFGSAGLDVPEGTMPNDYESEAYLFDPSTKTAEALTKDFDPTIVSAYWPAAGQDIFFVAEEADYVRLYRYNTGSRSFKRIDMGCDVIEQSDIARNNPVGIFCGSSASAPPRLFALDSRSMRARPFLDPTAGRFARVREGKVESWDFTSRDGRKIVGRVHYPPEFDAARKWPCIVYYYGGTSPVDRSFGGRYPKALWAAQGYVVYVLQPSGATGFGQEFSAAHVNDWGKIVSDEIIEGTKLFLSAHPFIDPCRVGCIGASFGGFMTELLVTKTNVFSAAVSHAGISSISSYWGEGYWGYDYSAVATANSFPWNRPDIYVGQSPLFAADKVNTPLLLLHGSADTNVPPGESEQMYTALKLLGKDVEYIRVEGQNHFVLDYKKRIMWSDAILAWFDRWLKGEGEWWRDMYPPVSEAADTRPKDIGLKKADLEKYGTTLFGEVTREDIEREIPGWGAEYDTYRPGIDAELRDRLEGYIGESIRIMCVMGTWCGDSKREVPRLWKIMDEAGYPMSCVRMYAVGSSRFTREMGVTSEILEWSKALKARYGVTAVPTIVVVRDGNEIGRIVEKPQISLEEDLKAILGASENVK